MRSSSAVELAVVSTPPVSTIVDNSSRRGVFRGEVDSRLSESSQAPAIMNVPGHVHKQSRSLAPGTAQGRFSRAESERRESTSGESNVDCRASIYVDARDESASELSVEDSSKRDSANMLNSESPQPSRRYTEIARSRSLGQAGVGCDAQDEVPAVMSLHPALGSIRVPSRRHSSALSPHEARVTLPSRRIASVRLKPLVLTPARTLATPLTTSSSSSSSKARRLSTPLAPSPPRRYSTPAAPRSVEWSSQTSPRPSDEHTSASPGMRRRSIGYRGEEHGEHGIDLYTIKRSGSTSSQSTEYPSDLSRRGSAETCDTDMSTPSTSPEKLSSRNRLPSLQDRFDPQRGLSLDVVLESEDDPFEPPRVHQEEEQAPPARYREFWGEEAARNESAFQDVCLALDELAPAFPSSSLLSSRSLSVSASPLSRSDSTTSEDSGASPRAAAARRGKPIVIQPSNGSSARSNKARRSRRISRNRLAQASEGESDLPPLPAHTPETPKKTATAASREKSANARPASSTDATKATPYRGPRPLVWPPPNETKRLSLAPPLAYDSDGDSESLETSDAESDEKVSLRRRVAFVPRPPRTRDHVETESGDFLDFLLTESPVAPATATVRLDATPASAVTPKAPVGVSSPQSTPQPTGGPKGLAHRVLSSFGASGQRKTSETSPKSLKKRPSSFMGKSKSATPAPAAPTRSRPVISGPLELEATETLHSTSSRESFNSVSTISLSRAQRSRSASVEVGRVPHRPTAVAAAVRELTDHDSVSEELLTLYTQIAPSSPSKANMSTSVPSSSSRSAKQLPPPPLLLSPLWSLPVTDLPRTPLAWAERSLHRSPSMSSVATNGTTAALIDSYA